MTRQSRYISTGIFIFFLLIYLYTLPPTVYWQDAGIYLSGIKVEGNVYPPGFPLYMIVGILWTKIIPIGSFTQKVHAISAVFAAISASLAYCITYASLENNFTLFKKKSSLLEEEFKRESIIPHLVLYSISLMAAVLTGFNFNLWAQATNAEVYSLHTFLFLCILYLIVITGIKGRIEKQITSIQKKLIITIALIYGLSYGNHPMTVILIPIFVFLLVSQKNLFYHARLLIVAVIIFIIAGLSTYIYLPLIANTEPSLNWGNPNTLTRFIEHVSGKAYLTTAESFVINDPARYQAALNEFLWEFGYLGLFIALFGLIRLYRSNKTYAVLFMLIILFHIIFAIFYKQTTEYNSWLIPAHCSIAILTAFAIYYGSSDLAWHLANRKNVLGKLDPIKPATYIYAVAYTLCVAGFLIFAVFHIDAMSKELNRSNYYYAQDFGENILRNLDQNSIIIMTGDQESSTVMYLQTVRNYRTDVIAFKNIEANELTYKEGRTAIKKRYPSLVLPEISSTKPENLTSSDYYNKLIGSNIHKHTIYLMSKNLFSLDISQYDLEPAAAMYKIVPKECSECHKAPEEKYWNFAYHDPNYYLKDERALMSLRDASIPGGVNRVPFIQHMINFELQSWKNLGDIYYEKEECKNAIKSYNNMARIDKNIFTKLPQIQQNIQNCSK